MERLKAFLQRDLFATGAGAELVLVEPGHAIARMLIGPRHHNAIGTAQGGAIFTLADFAFAAAVNSRGHVAVAINPVTRNQTWVTLGSTSYLTIEAARARARDAIKRIKAGEPVATERPTANTFAAVDAGDPGSIGRWRDRRSD